MNVMAEDIHTQMLIQQQPTSQQQPQLQAPLQQVQIVQQPLSASHLQHLYSPQQQILFPGNLILQHASMGTPTLQSLGGQNLSLQLQAKTTVGPKTSVGQSIQAVNTANETFQNQPIALQPKSLYSASLPVHSSAQVFNGSHLKQIASQPQIFTTQAPGTMFSQAQLLGLQALGSLLPDLSFTTPGCLQSTAFGQNPIIIYSQQPDMFIQQSQPQTAMHLPVAAATQPVRPTFFASSMVAPLKRKQVKIRPKVCLSAGPSPGAIPSPAMPQMATTQTQTNQSPPQAQLQPAAQLKSDAGNQTYFNQEKPQSAKMKSSGTQSKSMSVETKPLSLPQKSQAMVASAAKIVPASTLCVTIASPTSTLTTVSSMTSVMTNTKVLINSSVSTTEFFSSTVPSTPSVLPVPKVESKDKPKHRKPLSVLPCEPVVNSQLTEPPHAVPVENEHLKPQQLILKSSLGQVKGKQPQKAIVKAKVHIHIIDGFLIQESSEPFPVNGWPLFDSLCRVLPSDKPDSLQKRKDSPTVASPEKKMKVHIARGNVELATCVFCGKLGPKSKFKRSKRFCSKSCAKRFNVCTSKRTGLLPSAIQEQVTAGPGRKRKKGFRGRKSLRKLIEDESMEVTQIEENTSAPYDESTVSNKTEKENSKPPVDSPHPMNVNTEKDELKVLKTDSKVSQKPFAKWSVQDVFEFIRDLPGCSDYANAFKSQEIDGQALLLLKENHLMTAMCMKLEPGLKVVSQIKSMKEL